MELRPGVMFLRSTVFGARFNDVIARLPMRVGDDRRASARVVDSVSRKRWLNVLLLLLRLLANLVNLPLGDQCYLNLFWVRNAVWYANANVLYFSYQDVVTHLKVTSHAHLDKLIVDDD